MTRKRLRDVVQFTFQRNMDSFSKDGPAVKTKLDVLFSVRGFLLIGTKYTQSGIGAPSTPSKYVSSQR